MQVISMFIEQGTVMSLPCEIEKFKLRLGGWWIRNRVISRTIIRNGGLLKFEHMFPKWINVNIPTVLAETDLNRHLEGFLVNVDDRRYLHDAGNRDHNAHCWIYTWVFTVAHFYSLDRCVIILVLQIRDKALLLHQRSEILVRLKQLLIGLFLLSLNLRAVATASACAYDAMLRKTDFTFFKYCF